MSMSQNRDRSRWIALYVLCAGMLMIVLDVTVVNVALPSIKNDLGFSQSSLAWMAGLLVLSTFDVAVGLRTLARLRLRRRSQGLWIAATAAWGLLATALVGFLLRS